MQFICATLYYGIDYNSANIYKILIPAIFYQEL